MRPKRWDVQPWTGWGEAVTAAITRPSRRSDAVWSWSSRWRSKAIESDAGRRDSAGRNHVANESAFTAIDNVRVDESRPSSDRASCSSWASERAKRTKTWPDSVREIGLV